MSFDTVTEKALDLMREQTLGTGLTLDVLKHDPTRGYALIATIDRGWHIGQSAVADTQLTCQIIESSVIEESQLEEARAFAFDGAVYGIAEGEIRRPFSTWQHLWAFGLYKTTETYAGGLPAGAFLDESGLAFLDEAGNNLLDESV